MKRSVILFLIILLTKIISFSQTTSTPIENDSIITVTIEDLKLTNLIFIEHESLLKEKELMNKQLDNYVRKTSILQEQQDLLLQQNSTYVEHILYLEAKNKELNKVINNKNNWITGLTVGGVSVTVGLVLFLLLR